MTRLDEEDAKRTGIAAGGNWIVDRVKTVDCLPGRGMLGNIRSEERSTGGSPANVLADLARLGAPFPLTGVGVIGDDEEGRYILDTFRALGVNVDRIAVTPEAPTSYTDVMNEERSGDRAFYHHRGANALFERRHVPVGELRCRIFHLGYLLLLDGMDAPDEDYGTRAAAVLDALQREGIRTSVDVVSEESDRFKTLVPPALKHVDYLILNEIEAARSVGRTARDSAGKLETAALVEAVEELRAFGDMALLAVHMPEGVYVCQRDGTRFSAGSLKLPDGFIVGTVGAGDAFCAGMLYGLHEGWPVADAARLGTCSAAACLSAGGASDGVLPFDRVLELGERYPAREPPVAV